MIYQLERVWNGKVISPAPKFADICITDKRELDLKCLLSSTYSSMCCKAVKAEVLQKKSDHSNDYALRYGEDLVQSLPVFKYSNKVVFTDAILYNYTANPQSMMHSINYENTGFFEFSAYLRVLKFLKEENVWIEEDYARLRNYCAMLLCTKLFEFSRQSLPFRKKRQIIKKARQAEFYQNFLFSEQKTEWNLGKRTCMFMLFQKGYERTLIAYLWIYWKIQDIKKWLKR